MRRLIYVAHPIRPSSEELANAPTKRTEVGLGGEHFVHVYSDRERMAMAIESNMDRAIRWLSWHRLSFPGDTFIAPYVAALMSGEDDSDPAAREAGLVDACRIIEACDGISLCGGRVSSGMARERDHGLKFYGNATEFCVFDHTTLTIEAPNSLACEPIGVWRVWV